MSRTLPPLNALRAFEAAARHLSFTKAAGELSVTQAAISHQVKALEEYLGIRLFRRLNRALLLTEEGQAYMPAVRESFDRISQATAALKRRDVSGALTVTSMPSFAAKWLVPRLARFRENHPDIDVRLTTSPHLVDFGREDVDIGIRYGTGNYPGLEVQRLMEDAVFPVCSPGLLSGRAPLREPADLARHTLLHDDYMISWATWLTAAGLQDIDPKVGPYFDQSDLMIQAAIAGQGVALGRSSLVEDDLLAGRLVRPFELALTPPHAYFLVCLPGMLARPKVAAFHKWLTAEMSRIGGRPAVPEEATE